MNIRKANIQDKKRIKTLYQRIYGSFYSLPEIQDEELMEEILKDENNIWTIAEDGNKVVGSLIFRVNKEISITKALGAVVDPEYRNRGIFNQMFDFGIKSIDTEIIYALTRTITPEPQRLLIKHNFIPLGIFPNVRRIYAYENHGLYALIKPTSFTKREKLKKMLPEINEIFKILKDIIIKKFVFSILKKNYDYIHLESFISEEIDIIQRKKLEFEPKECTKIDLKVIGVEDEYLENYENLRFKFFPFHKPNFKIMTDYGNVFLHLNMLDKHCAIMGIETDLEDIEKVYNLFFNIPYIVDKLDARYLEIISMAVNYNNHNILLDNGFIPAAYFPSLIPYQNKRVDGVIFFYPYNLPHLKKMFVPDEFKPYIKYVYSMIVKKINDELNAII